MLICSNKIRETEDVYVDGVYHHAQEIKSQRRILKRVGAMNYESVDERVTKRLSKHRYEVIAKSSFEAEILIRELFECDEVYVHEIDRFKFVVEI